MKLAIMLLMFTNLSGQVQETHAFAMPKAECLAMKKYYDPETPDLPRTTLRMDCLYVGANDD